MAAQLIPNDGGNLRILTMATTWTTKRCAAIKVTNSSHGACPFSQVDQFDKVASPHQRMAQRLSKEM